MKNKAVSCILSVIIVLVQTVALFFSAVIFVADDYISGENIIKQTETLDLSSVLGGTPANPIVTEFSSPAKSSAEVVSELALVFDVIQDYWTLPLGSGVESWRVVINVTGDNAKAATYHAKQTLADYLKAKSIYSSVDEMTSVFAEAYTEYAYEHGYIKSSDRASCKAEVDKHLTRYISTLNETELFTPVSFGASKALFSVTGERGAELQNYFADMFNGARDLAIKSYAVGFIDYVKYGATAERFDTAAVEEYIINRTSEAAGIYGFSLSEIDKEKLAALTSAFISGELSAKAASNLPDHSAADALIGADTIKTLRTIFKPIVKWTFAAVAAVLAVLCFIVWKKRTNALYFESAAFILAGAALGVAGVFVKGFDLSAPLSSLSSLGGGEAVANAAVKLVSGFSGALTLTGLLAAGLGVLLLLAAAAFRALKSKKDPPEASLEEKQEEKQA